VKSRAVTSKRHAEPGKLTLRRRPDPWALPYPRRVRKDRPLFRGQAVRDFRACRQMQRRAASLLCRCLARRGGCFFGSSLGRRSGTALIGRRRTLRLLPLLRVFG
jgi:hypothetical protein